MLREKIKRSIMAYDHAVESFFEAMLIPLSITIILTLAILPWVKWSVFIGLFYKLFLE